MDVLSLKLSRRTVTGKKVKRLRRAGYMPVHFYGSGTESLSMQVEAGALQRLITRSGYNIPVSVQVEGEDGENICFVREVQRHPVTEDLLHVDLMRVDVTQTLTAEVPIVLEGEAPAVQDLGGTLIQPFTTLAISALPMNMPELLSIDISVLDDFDKSLRIGDLQLPPQVTVLRDPDELVATVAPPRIEEEEEAAEVEAEEAEVEIGEEGEPAEAEGAGESGRQVGPGRTPRE